MAVNQRHREVAARLGADFARMIEESLPRIAEAVSDAEATASFTVTAQFATNREGDLVVVLKPRERIPLDPIEHKLSLNGDQLALFEGAPRGAPPENSDEEVDELELEGDEE